MTKILYSPGYGAGWSSWNDGSPEFQKWLLTYPPIIEALERGERLAAEHPAVQSLEKQAREMFGKDYVCVLGAGDLRIADVSGPFRIDEYDGSERVQQADAEDWIVV